MSDAVNKFPVKAVPPGAWDTHHHIFEPDRFPFAAGRHFTPARASLEQLRDFEKSIGVEHVCIAHGLSYGADCTSLLYYLGQFGGTARGICVLDLDTVTDELLNTYHEAGVRSVRLDFFRHQAMNDVRIQTRLIEATARRLAQWGRPGWSIQIQQPHLHFWHELRKIINDSPIPVVVDHFALIEGSSYRADDEITDIQNCSYLTEKEHLGLQELCQTLREGNLWIKLSAPNRCSNMAPGFQDLRWLVRLFVDANSKRVVWGSDWPHTQRHKDRIGKEASSEEAFLKVDDKGWIESLSQWMSEEEWQALWVGNPATLYDY
ncbi:hypothetical protein BO79DRAFT_261009 [Aspergillus costaricaensis CBS 115574]|uniref:Uncharacterized protein n=1 Tax=Aspergillus costaricaensis CBS 115574 TaxID=1448317 RepID=A0ACD1ITY8_9EURO|nr:hypothetical protein BO79DRAFT_261009 [Aspergillus costaricaensis CBS 115574]RAK94086.1 hypothetical protein BO79DRAFT_261009 [Aspergillus costaricaensis CBS 115574]